MTMAYNFLCKATSEPNWSEINRLLGSCDRLEAFPMIESSDAEYGLAISIPMKQIGAIAYEQFVRVQKVLRTTYGFTIYDMYYGKEVDEKHLVILKEEIT